LRAPTLQIRRQALDLLARAPRREGMWESDDAVMVAGDALSKAEESSDASEVSVSPPPQEYSPFEARRMWEEMSNGYQTDHSTLPSHQHIGEQSTALLDELQFVHSINSMDRGSTKFSEGYIEYSGYKSKAGTAYV